VSCEDTSQQGRGSCPPRPGDVWWPVIGGPETLEAVPHAIAATEASTTSDGTDEVAPFPRLEGAERFASRNHGLTPRTGSSFGSGEPTPVLNWLLSTKSPPRLNGGRTYPAC